MFNPVSYVKQNPVVGGLGVFVVGLASLYFLGFFKSSASSGDNGASAYYAATVADAQSGNQLQEAYVNAAATTAQTQIAADAYTTTQTKWADTQLGIAQSNNNTALGLAPYQVQGSLIGALGQAAGQTQTVTTSSSSNGFFGIGGGSKNTTTTSPTPLATSSADALQQILHNMELNTVH